MTRYDIRFAREPLWPCRGPSCTLVFSLISASSAIRPSREYSRLRVSVILHWRFLDHCDASAVHLSVASSSDLEIARHLLARETASASESDEGHVRLGAQREIAESRTSAAATAGNRVLARLQAHLTRLFGLEGFEAIFVRALSRAQTEHPLLRSAIATEPRSEAKRLNGVISTEAGGSSDEVNEAVAVLIGTIIALTKRLVGNEMTNQFIEQIWPAAVRHPRDEGETESSSAKPGPNPMTTERIAE